MLHHWSMQLQVVLLLLCTWYASGQHYAYSQERNAALPVPPRFLVPGAFLAPPLEQTYQPQPQPKNLPANADVTGVQADDRRLRRPFVGRRRPDEPAVGNTAAPPTITETYRQTTWSTQPLLLQQSPQSSVAAPSQPPPFYYTTTQRALPAETNPPAASTRPDDDSAEEGFTRKLPATVSPYYRPNKVQYYPINNPNIIDENEESAVFHNIKTEIPHVSTTAAAPETESPNYTQRKPSTPRFSTNNIRTPRPPQKARSHPPSQPVILPPTPPQPRTSYEHAVDTENNKITRTYDNSRRHESNQPHGKRIKKPVAQVLKKYRDDNPDGTITWGFENDDGSYKEEIIGNDCVTRGKYGYIDPDGVRREYTYVQGLPCDRNKLKQEEEEDEEDANANEPEPDIVVKHRARKPVQKF